MRRLNTTPRDQWQEKVAEAGLIFHESPDGPYWLEAAYYEFTLREVEELEAVSEELHELCLAAVAHVIDRDRFAELAIPDAAAALICDSFREERSFSLYGRFDLAYDGDSPPKLLEYNADTPTMLVEASVVQWHWLEEKFRSADQFNSIHEKLLAQWAKLKWPLRHKPLYFTCAQGSLEDLATVGYLEDTAAQAGLETAAIMIEEIGWNHQTRKFVDLEGREMGSLFKLYPWEWLLKEEFGPFLLETYRQMQWLEPLWKLVLSNKGILPILWELNPGHPNLLAAWFSEPSGQPGYVRKPRFSREGGNLAIYRSNILIQETPGSYGQEGFIFQELAAVPDFSGHFPIIGSWVIGGAAAGMGVRESTSAITDHRSRFVPHLFG